MFYKRQLNRIESNLLSVLLRLQRMERLQNKMATNDALLTQAVADLNQEYTALTQAIDAEVALLKQATTDKDDDAITAAVSSIEGIVSQMKTKAANASGSTSTSVPVVTPSTDSTTGTVNPTI